MAFEFKLDTAAAEKNVFGGKKTKSGIGKFVIEAAYMKQTKNGNNVIDIVTVNEAGGKAIIFGHCIDEKWSSGAENPGYNAFQELAVIAGMQTGQTVASTRVEKGTTVPAVEFAELKGKTLWLGIQEVYSVGEDGRTQTTSYKLSKTFREGDPAIETMEIKDYFDKKWTAAKANNTLIVPTNDAPATEGNAPAQAEPAETQGGLF